MMKYIALAGLGILASVSAANATTSYCGYSSEATDSLYTGPVTINGHSVPDLREQDQDGGLGTGGEAYRGNHRYCGTMAFYLYTGTSPADNVTIDIDLNPDIVAYNVAETKCTATLFKVDPTYADDIGVTAASWYPIRPITYYFAPGYTGSESPPRRHVYLVIAPSSDFEADKVYGVTVDCPTNVPNGA